MASPREKAHDLWLPLHVPLFCGMGAGEVPSAREAEGVAAAELNSSSRHRCDPIVWLGAWRLLAQTAITPRRHRFAVPPPPRLFGGGEDEQLSATSSLARRPFHKAV